MKILIRGRVSPGVCTRHRWQACRSSWTRATIDTRTRVYLVSTRLRESESQGSLNKMQQHHVIIYIWCIRDADRDCAKAPASQCSSIHSLGYIFGDSTDSLPRFRNQILLGSYYHFCCSWYHWLRIVVLGEGSSRSCMTATFITINNRFPDYRDTFSLFQSFCAVSIPSLLC